MNIWIPQFGYLRRVELIQLNLLRQRWKYFVRGNSHGVSANWLRKRCDGIYSSVGEFLESDPFSFPISSETLKEGERVFEAILQEKSGVNYGNNYDCEIGLASFLFAYILTRKPLTVVETGVANGITTNTIMKALEITGGILHSFDIDARTQNVYSGPGNWKFHLLSGNLKESLKSQIHNIGSVDLWIHDSNHGYSWQTAEYNLASRVLSFGGVLVSDDIDSSTAWGLSSKKYFESSNAIFDHRKFIGVAHGKK